MGAWGHEVFENDDALDWVAELEESEDASALVTAFDAIPDDADEYVEAPEASAALAAAEVVAAMLGKPGRGLPKEAAAWVKGHRTVSPKLQKRARRAVSRILANSELAELWAEGNDFGAWKASVEDLLRRLS
jgi:hypothetical protein